MGMTDVMLDIETTGTDPGCAGIMQIAAIQFNYDTGEIGPIFNRCLSMAPQRFWDEDRRRLPTAEGGKSVYMHRQLMGFPQGKLVDHRDNDTMNYTRGNLRITDKSGNGANSKKQERTTSSRYKGVTLTNSGWRARIKLNGVTYSLGNYVSEHDAAKAYNDNAIRIFGEFANLNEIANDNDSNDHHPRLARRGHHQRQVRERGPQVLRHSDRDGEASHGPAVRSDRHADAVLR